MLFITALTAAAAQISIPLPMTAVPLTFQPMVVLVGGLALGSRLALASQVLYLAVGIAGLPVFAASATLPPGALRLLGPTGGYLMAYPVAAFVAGYLAERGFDRRYITSVLAMFAGLAIIFVSGVTWLGLFARTVTWQRASWHAGRARDWSLSVHPAGRHQTRRRRRPRPGVVASGGAHRRTLARLACAPR